MQVSGSCSVINDLDSLVLPQDGCRSGSFSLKERHHAKLNGMIRMGFDAPENLIYRLANRRRRWHARALRREIRRTSLVDSGFFFFTNGRRFFCLLCSPEAGCKKGSWEFREVDKRMP